MTNWTTTVTNKGIALQSKQVRGATLSFTRVVGGSGSVSLVVLKEQTEVSNIKQTISIESIRVLDAKYTITVLLSNSNSNSGYNLSQIGFYATDPDEGEILFAIAQADTPEFIPSKDEAEGFCLEFAFTFQNSNNSTIKITPDPAGYMTREGVDDVVFETQKDLTISGKASGNVITIKDSTDAPLADVSIFGASEQTITTGKNMLNVTTETQTKNGITFVVNKDKSVTISGTAAGLFAQPLGSVELKANTKYFIGGCPPTGSGDTYRLDGRELEENGAAAISEIIDYGQGVFFAPTTDRTINICIRVASGATISNVTFKPIVQLASIEDTSYEQYTGGIPGPNPDYPLEINSVGDSGNIQVNSCCKSLVKNTATTQTKNGITFTVNADKTVTVNGTATSDVSLFVFTNLQNVLKVGERYILNGSPSGCSTDTCYMEINHIWYGDVGEGSAFTYKEGITGCYIVVRSGVTVSNKVFKPMIRLATVTDDSYEQHKKTTATIPLTDPLRGIPVSSGGNYTDASGQEWICDEIDLARGVYIQRIGSTIIDGSKPFTKNNGTEYDTNFVYFTNKSNFGIDTSRYEGFCSHLLCAQSPSLGGVCLYMNGFSHVLYIDAALFLDNDSSINSATNLATALNENPIEIKYILTTPIETPLTEEQLTALQSLQTFEPTTNIFVDSELANLDVEYYKNTDNGRAIGKVKQENVELRALIGDINSILESVIGGA